MIEKDNLYNRILTEKEIEYYSALFIDLGDAKDDLKFELFRTKFAMVNAIRISMCMGYPANYEMLDTLFEGLQDANWPFFGELVEMLISSYPRNILVNAIDATLIKADNDEDYLWISGLYILGNRIQVKVDELKNYRLFDKRDF